MPGRLTTRERAIARVADRLAFKLQLAAGELRECGCTCLRENKGHHARACVGVMLARKYERAQTAALRTLDRLGAIV